MKKKIPGLVLVCGMLIVLVTSEKVIAKTSSEAEPENYRQSFLAGYNTMGVNFRYDFVISEKLLKKGVTRLYLEAGGNKVRFEQENFSFSHIIYSSNCRLIIAGIGLEQEYTFGRTHLSPYVGAHFAYVRFTDRTLVDAIGENGLQRYRDAALTQPVGPPVENAYGNAATFDAGCRLGVLLTSKIELLVSTGYSPLEFSTSSTLFGRYWGEAPYPNQYWVKIRSMRFELGLKLRF
jgi:hypothetical protein